MNSRFEHLVVLYKGITFDSDASEGSLLLDTQEKYDILRDALQEGSDTGFTLEGGDVAIGNTVLLNVGPPRLSLGRMFRKFDDFLENPKNRIQEPRNYYIFDLDYSKHDVHAPVIIKNYRVVLNLISLFRECAAYLDEINGELVYFDKDVTKISINYSSDDIQFLNVDLINNLLSLFLDDTHRDQKLTILGSSIKSICENKNKDAAFSHLLHELPSLKESFDKGYKVFVSGFSYEKIIDQLRTAKVEEMGKIHKTFSDIQNHILGIPVATVIVATQLKHSTVWDGQAIINSAIMIGCIIFSVLVSLVLCNQLQTLNAISEEIKFKKKQIDKEYPVLSGDVAKTFKHLFRRLIIQRVAIFFVAFVLIIGVTLTFFAYMYFTEPALNNALELWQSFRLHQPDQPD